MSNSSLLGYAEDALLKRYLILYRGLYDIQGSYKLFRAVILMLRVIGHGGWWVGRTEKTKISKLT